MFLGAGGVDKNGDGGVGRASRTETEMAIVGEYKCLLDQSNDTLKQTFRGEDALEVRQKGGCEAQDQPSFFGDPFRIASE